MSDLDDDCAFSIGSGIDDDELELPTPIVDVESTVDNTASTVLGDIKSMLSVLITKVSENEKAILALKEEMK